MPRKLKTFQTSLGFYDLAIAAPSMKAASKPMVERHRGAKSKVVLISKSS